MPTKTPIIAIIGRPNVGKSTLFNRMTGTRDALVSDLPGLTRDRKIGAAKIGGRDVELIDTAGLEESARGSIAARMREQSETALHSADLILFVIDARAGVTPADQTFARIARTSGKPVLLVTNKAEGRAAEAGIIDAFSMGLGDPIPISAEHGEGIGDLESLMLRKLGLTPKPTRKGGRRRKNRDAEFDELEAEAKAEAEEQAETGDGTEPTDARAVRVAIIGRPNAGKSTLVNALLGEDRMITGPEPGLTRDSVATDTVWNDRPIKLWDTAGLRRKARIDEKAEKLSASDAIRAIKYADVAVILIDAERPLEQQDLIIAGRAIDEGRAVVLAVNKWDLIADKQKALRDLRESVAEQLSQVFGLDIEIQSARSGRGLDNLKAAVLRAYDIWNSRIPTHKLNQWLETALSRHAPPLASGRRIKIRYMTQVSARPPTFVAFSAKAARLPDAYVKYLVNSLRERFDMPGTPVRFNLRKPDNPFAED